MEMSLGIEIVLSPITIAISKIITGQLFSEEEIERLSKHTIGKHFKELFPVNENDQDIGSRVNNAQKHIAAAGSIVSSLQQDLTKESENLDLILEDIKAKKIEFEKYQELAEIDKKKIDHLKAEMQTTLRNELTNQSNKGKWGRRFLWVMTLLIGAALGAYFKDIVAWLTQIGTLLQSK